MVFNVLIGLAAFFGGWTLNRIYQAIDRLDTDVRAVPLKYVNKDDYKSDMKDVKEMLHRILDKLDGKVDK
jgi:predicted RNA-binding protein with EMAP domain